MVPHTKNRHTDKTETQVDCDTIIPPYYKIDGSWINLLPKPVSVEKTITTFKSRISRNWEPKELNQEFQEIGNQKS